MQNFFEVHESLREPPFALSQPWWSCIFLSLWIVLTVVLNSDTLARLSITQWLLTLSGTLLNSPCSSVSKSLTILTRAALLINNQGDTAEWTVDLERGWELKNVEGSHVRLLGHQVAVVVFEHLPCCPGAMRSFTHLQLILWSMLGTKVKSQSNLVKLSLTSDMHWVLTDSSFRPAAQTREPATNSPGAFRQAQGDDKILDAWDALHTVKPQNTTFTQRQRTEAHG